MRRFLTIITLVAAAAVTASAADWVQYATSANATDYYDSDSVHYSAGSNSEEFATVWVKIVYPDGDYLVGHWQLARVARTWCSLSSAMYSADGKLKSGPQTSRSEWQEIFPESVAEVLYNILFKARTRSGERF
jgi:hypothetical protein